MKVNTFLRIINPSEHFLFDVQDKEQRWNMGMTYEELEKRYGNREIIEIAPNEDYFDNLAFNVYIK